MRICIVSELEYGNGAAIAAFRLANAIAEAGHEIHYIFRFPKPGPNSQIIAKKQLARNRPSLWDQIVFKIFKLLRLNASVKINYLIAQNDSELRGLIKDINPDIVNLHNVARILKHDSVVSLGYSYPIVWTLHDLWPINLICYQFKNRLGHQTKTSFWKDTDSFDSQIVDRLLNSNSNISFISPSQWLSKTVSTIVKQRKQIDVIPNGLSVHEFHAIESLEARHKLGLSKDGFYILFLSSKLEQERKNIQVLMEAFDQLKDTPIKVIALGSTSPEFREKYPLILFFDPTFDSAELRTIYSAANVFLITSLVDNLPNTVLESLFCGTPVIGANVGGIPEMVIPEKTGWLFDPYNSQELADLILQTYEQRDLLPEISNRCQSWAKEQFNLEKQRDNYLKIFSESQKAAKDSK